jgi:hypothetical protein
MNFFQLDGKGSLQQHATRLVQQRGTGLPLGHQQVGANVGLLSLSRCCAGTFGNQSV